MSFSSRISSLTPCPSPSPEPPIVQPDHFYGSEGIPLPPSPNSDGKTWLDPEDDAFATRGIPVFKPTMEEFEDFEAYMEKINCWGLKSGIVKVIPPKEWTESLPDIKPQLGEVKIRSPIEQVMLGSGGLFRQQNMEKRRVMSVREWAELCSKDEYRAPAKQDIGLESRGARVPTARAPRRVRKKEPTNDVQVKEEPIDESALGPAPRPSSVPSPPPSEAAPSPSSGSRDSEDVPNQRGSKAQPKPKGKRVHQTREARQASLADRAARDSQFINTFDPHADWLPPNTSADDYSPEYCQKLERHYWRNCGLGRSAWYGADTQGTLYTDETRVWNVGRLPSALSRLLPASDKGLPGVNTPYLYFGMWRATFAWHVEDMDLYSINYIHFGAPKFWYAVPQGKANALEHAMRTYFPKDTSQCPQFLRHKSFLASPTTLAKSSCRPNHLVQQAGEFVITYPRGYHAGFNLGFNCAESVNFALECWIEMGRVAKACKCVPDSVRIDVDQLLRDRAEEAMQAFQAQDAPHTPKSRRTAKRKAVPSPASVKTEVHDGVIPPLRIALKRKIEDNEELPKPKKIKLKPSPKAMASSSDVRTNGVVSPTKVSVKLKLGPKPAEPEPFPCCLCISMDRNGLLRVQDPPIGRKDAIEAAGYPKIWMAHEHCALIIPETWVDEHEQLDRSKEKVVLGVDAIVKDRWNLKCSMCTKNRQKAHGAPVQCTKGKCPKAFHVSCAKEGDTNGIVFSVVRQVEKEVVLMETHPMATVQDPTQMQVDSFGQAIVPPEVQVLKVVKKLECQILCPQHNPALAAQKKASKQEKIKNDLLALPTMSRIKIRVSSGVFEVSLLRVIEETGSVEVLWDRGLKREFKWGSVVFGSTDVPVQQKPSELKVPLQAEHERSVSVAASTASIPVQTYPSIVAATSAGPRLVTPNPSRDQVTPKVPTTQPATSSQYPYGAQAAVWTYTSQQVPYGHQASYPYPYSGYYHTAGFVAPSQAFTYPPMYRYGGVHHSTSEDSRIQWQRPYEGPANPTLIPIHQATTSQVAGTNLQTPANFSPSTATPVSAQSHSPTSDASPSEAGEPSETGTAGVENKISIASNLVPNPQPPAPSQVMVATPTSQNRYPDLSTLARLPPEELTDILSKDPDLRNYIMAAVQQSHPPPAPPTPAQTTTPSAN